MHPKVNYADLAVKVVADECRRSFFYFLRTFWDVIITEEPVYNWHIEELCNELQALAGFVFRREKKPYDLVINIPPGTTKSTITTIMFPVWMWCVDSTIRIITNSYSADLSVEHATKSRDIILSEKYQTLFPDVQIRKDKFGKESYENTAGGARYTTSTGGAITGKHGHIILNDDPMNPKQASSEPMRLQANEHTKTLSSRKVNKANTPMVTIMQRLHEEDTTGYLLKKKGEKIRLICLPAEVSSKISPPELADRYIDGYLDPVRLGREVLDEAKVDLGGRQYSGQFEQVPSSEQGNIIRKEWFRSITVESFSTIRKKGGANHFFLDTAFDEKKKKSDNDPSGIIGACKIGPNLYIYAAQKVYKKFPDLIRFLPDFLFANGYTGESTLRIEPKANGVSVVHQLEDSTSLNVTRTPTPTDSKEVRLNAASPKIECGRVYLVEGAWNEDFIEEVCGFPTKVHDEYVDLLCYAVGYFLDKEDATEQPEGFEEFIYD